MQYMLAQLQAHDKYKTQQTILSLRNLVFSQKWDYMVKDSHQ